MGLIARFFGSSNSKPDLVSRRKFLRTVITAAPAAVAAAAAIDLAFVPEVRAAAREELRKLDEMVEGDLGLKDGRIQVAAPKTMFDTARVWRSVANEAGAWAEYLHKTQGVAHGAALSACTRLARLLDHDLTGHAPADAKIDVALPHVVRTWKNWNGEKHVEIALGVHREKLYDGTEQLAVKFKAPEPKLVDARGKALVTKLPDRADPDVWTDAGASLERKQTELIRAA